MAYSKQQRVLTQSEFLIYCAAVFDKWVSDANIYSIYLKVKEVRNADNTDTELVTASWLKSSNMCTYNITSPAGYFSFAKVCATSALFVAFITPYLKANCYYETMVYNGEKGFLLNTD